MGSPPGPLTVAHEWDAIITYVRDRLRLPALPTIVPMATVMFGPGMSSTEMAFHVDRLDVASPSHCTCMIALGMQQLAEKLEWFHTSGFEVFCCALLTKCHWSPVVAICNTSGALLVVMEADTVFDVSMFRCSEIVVQRVASPDHLFCGVHTWAVLARFWVTDVSGNLGPLRSMLRSWIPADLIDDDDVGFGPNGPLIKQLCAELAKHGIPAEALEERAQSAIRALGSEQLLTALNHRQPWRQLKALGNNSKFQFVLPSELSKAVESQKGKPVKGKGKGKGKAKASPQMVDLDPAKLQILEGTFRFQDRVLPQLVMKQIGPLSSEVIMMSLPDADPYLRAGARVSQEPLALVVLHRADVSVQTALPHASVSVPCRCTIDSEPVLVDAVLVQVGQGTVEKVVGSALLSVDTPDVVTLKVLVYRDELKGDWDILG